MKYSGIYTSFKKTGFGLLAILFLLIISCNENSFPKDNLVLNTYADSLATHLFQSNQKEKAFRFIDSVYSIPVNQSISGLHVKYSWKITECKYKNGETTICELNYLDSIFYLIEQSHKEKEYPEFYASAFISKGDYFMKLKNYNTAFDYYERGLKIIGPISSLCILSGVHYRMAMVYYKQGKIKEANIFFKKNLLESRFCQDSWVMFANRQEMNSNVASCYILLAQPDSALLYGRSNIIYMDEYVQKHSIKEVASLNYIFSAKAVVYANIADAFYLLNKSDSAKKYYRQSININSKPGFDNNHAQSVQLSLAKLYLANNETDKARQELNNLKSSLDIAANESVMVNYKYAESSYYEKINQPQKAMGFLKQYYADRDSENEKEKAIVNLNMKDKLDVADKKYQIDILKKENQLKKVYMRFTIVALLSSVALIILGFMAYGRKHKIAVQLMDLNKKINTQKSELLEAGKEKDKILRVVAHDLRNPLSAIYTATENMLEEKGTPEENNNVLQLVKKATAGSLQLIDTLLDVNKQKVLVKEPVNMQQLIKECANVFAMTLQQKHLKFNLDLPDEVIVINANAAKIERVLNNLISNAIKFSNADTYISIRLNCLGNNIIMSVEDEGIGIPQFKQSEVFEVFTDAKRMGTAGEKSFGLGLSISKEIVEAHGGRIWVESEEGKGCKFFVQLPAEG